ncbi:MAG: DNRLRE domain-containing protein [Verrucomicrobia bacterium]|nr:DNRLRE domain-containing protein [Verrucomicrobiota bacterium]
MSLSGSNAALLQRITGAWNDTTVTWNNQPATTNVNEVPLLQSTNPNQDYLNIDVTSMVMDMIQYPSSSYGFMIKLQNENYFRSMIFASSNHPDCNKHPKLEIKYTMPTGIHEISDNTLFSIAPNPSTGEFMVSWNSSQTHFDQLEIVNYLGQKISSEMITPGNSNSIRIHLNDEAKGIYFVKLSGKNTQSVQKLILD